MNPAVSSDRSSGPRPLTSAEIDHVAGGVLPIVAAAAVGLLAAALIDAVSDDDSSESEGANEEQGD